MSLPLAPLGHPTWASPPHPSRAELRQAKPCLTCTYASSTTAVVVGVRACHSTSLLWWDIDSLGERARLPTLQASSSLIRSASEDRTGQAEDLDTGLLDSTAGRGWVAEGGGPGWVGICRRG